MSNIFPEVRDVSNVGAQFTSPLFMPVAIEGQGGSDGNADVGVVYTVFVPSDADTLFGLNSPLSSLVKFVMSRGVAPVYASASVMSGTPPTLIQRQAVWSTFESMPQPRIRMTDDTTQATLEALAISCENADKVYNKQVGFGGLAAGSTKSTLISVAEAINSKRFVLVGPGIFDSNNVLRSGNYAAAIVAAEVAKNSDISDDLDLLLLVNSTGIEVGANNQPVFSKRVVSGSVVNDFADLLQAGVSPLMTDQSGNGLRVTHLRMTYSGQTPGSDTTFDALETRLILDQLFVDIRDYVVNNNFLRKGNTQTNRDDLAAGVAALLTDRSNWVSTVTQPDGSQGYNVAVISSPDFRSVTVSYSGVINRNIQVVQVDAELTVPV